MMKPKHALRALRTIPRRVRWMLAVPVMIVAAFAIDADAGFSAAFGLSQAGPVGGVVAGAAEARCLDKGLQQQRAVAVERQLLLGQGPGRLRQEHGGEVLGVDPGHDQEAGIVDDPMEMMSSRISALSSAWKSRPQ